MGSLQSAVRVVRAGLSAVWSDLWTALVCEFIWLLSIALILPAPPATVALFYFTNRQAHGEVAGLGDFWEGLRRYWLPAWRWGAVNLVMLLILGGDIYLLNKGQMTALNYFLQGFYLVCLTGWVIIQFYTLPFLLEQEKPAVFTALRNGALMFARNPGFTLWVILLLLLLCAAGTVLFLLSLGFGGALVAATGNRAVLDRLAVQISDKSGKNREDL